MTDTIESPSSVDVARSVAAADPPLGETMYAVLEGTVTRAFAPTFDGPPPEQGVFGRADWVVQTLGAVLSIPGELVDAGLAGITSAILPTGMGMPAAVLGGGMHLGLPHFHPQTVLLGVPMPGVGPTAVIGALTVHIGGMPALRCGDVGFALGCLGSPVFEVFTGSSNVFIGGKRAARAMDFTRHCDPFLGLLSPGAAIGSAIDLMSCAAAATNFAAHTAAAVSHSDDAESAETAGEAEIARAEAALEMQQAIVNSIQIIADASLSAFSSTIGAIPPVGLMGDGLVMGAVASNVLIGGLPFPATGDIVNAWVHHWMRRAAGAAWRRLRGHPDANGRGGCDSDPVGLIDGNVFGDFLDAQLGGFSFGRHYDTRSRERLSRVGTGHRHTFDRELRVWLHRCEYTDADGVTVAFPPFRGRDEVQLFGRTLRRIGQRGFEVRHRGETMRFVSYDDTRDARLVSIERGESRADLRYDPQGLLCSLEIGREQFTLEADEDGRITAIRDVRGHELVAYRYSSDGSLVDVRDAAGGREQFEYRGGRLVAWRDKRGHRYIWRYDDAGRCVFTRGDGGEFETRFEYLPGKTRVTRACGTVLVHHFDARGLVTRIEREDGGYRTRASDADGCILSEIDAAGREVTWAYDATGAHTHRVGRFGEILPPASGLIERSRRGGRGRPTTLAPQLGLSPIAAGADAARTPVGSAELRAWALPPCSPSREPAVERDAMGRVTRWSDGRGRATRYRRDGAGNVVETIDRDGGVTSFEIHGSTRVGATVDGIGRRCAFTHTSVGKTAAYVDPVGSVTEYVRDGAERVTSILRNGASRETYVFDAGDRLVEKRGADGNWLLRVTSHANALPKHISLASGGFIAFEYDARGRATEASTSGHRVELRTGGEELVLLDRRDGRGVSRARAEGVETVRLFDRFTTQVQRSACRIDVHDPTGGLHTFDAASGRIVRQLSNGTCEELAFDEDGRLEGRVVSRQTGDALMREWAVRYERSGEGDLLSEWDSVRGRRRFEVDAAHRLAMEISPAGLRLPYLLDAADNVIGKPGLSWATHAHGSVLVETESEAFEHDERGRMAVRRSGSFEVRYEYDSLDQLVRVDDGGVPWTATYDGLGRRCRFGRGSSVTELFWDGDRIAAELSHTGELRVHVYAAAPALVPFMFVDYAHVDAAPQTGRPFFVFHDASGMPIQIEDQSGRIVWWVDRVDPFGALAVHEGSKIDYRLRWPGHYSDADLGLHYNRYRDYDPHLARYLQPDPIGHAGSPHSLYAYAPNPLVVVDLDGLSCEGGTEPAAEDGAVGRPLVEGDPEGTYRDAEGRLRGEDGRYVTDPRVPQDDPITLFCTRIGLGQEHLLSDDDVEVRLMLDARRSARFDKVIALMSGDDEEHAAAARRERMATEVLGELAADDYVRRHYGDAELIHDGGPSGTFDRTYRLPGPPPTTLVVEAKGGTATESASRRVGSDRAQQGTPEYRADVAREMEARGRTRGDERMRAAGAAVLASGARTIYIGVSQPIGRGGHLGKARAYRYGPSRRRSAPSPAPPP